MKSRLIKTLGCALTLLFAVPSLALTSVASTSSRQACAGVSTSSAASQAAVTALSCKVTVVNDWGSGYQVAVTVTNTGTVNIDTWKVFLTIPGEQGYVTGWDAVITQISPTQIELRKPSWQGPLLPGQSATVSAQFKKPAGTGGVVTCHTQIAPPPNTAPQGEFTAAITHDTVHVKSVNVVDAEGDKLTHSFDFGDGVVINSNDAWHSYKTPGTYTITQTISDGKLSKVNKNTVSVTVAGNNRAPVAVFSYNTSRLTASLNAKGSADKDGQALTYAWDFGQGITAASTNPNTSVTLPHGGGNVVLTVFDGELGNSFQYSVPANSCMSYDAAPQLAFSSEVNGSSVTLDASASKVVDGFNWDFGDGATGTGMFASHTYAAPGTYTITLRGTAQMMSATKTAQIVIADTTPINLPPVAELSCTELVAVGDDFENGIAYYTYTTRCDATASLDPEGQPLSFSMNWGDGKTTTSTNGIFIYKYLTGGEYNLTLSVSDGVNTAQKSLPWIASNSTVNNRPPVACFDIAAGNTLTVNASCSSDPDSNPLTYAWDFGDGSSATGVNTTHNYSAAGSYTVKLTVSDGKTTSVLSKTFVANVVQKPTRCEFQITNSWSGGFTGWFRVYNQSTSPISGWAGVITFAPGTNVTSYWNGTVVGANPYQVTPAAWNATLQPGTFAQVGFMVWDGATTHPTPQVSGPSCE